MRKSQNGLSGIYETVEAVGKPSPSHQIGIALGKSSNVTGMGSTENPSKRSLLANIMFALSVSGVQIVGCGLGGGENTKTHVWGKVCFLGTAWKGHFGVNIQNKRNKKLV